MANTISHIKRIIGRKFSEADIATEQDEFVNYKLVRLEDDEIGIEVRRRRARVRDRRPARLSPPRPLSPRRR